jgi:hypothetical protein
MNRFTLIEPEKGRRGIFQEVQKYFGVIEILPPPTNLS